MSISITLIPSLQHIPPLFHNEGNIQQPPSVSQWNPETNSHRSEDDETKIRLPIEETEAFRLQFHSRPIPAVVSSPRRWLLCLTCVLCLSWCCRSLFILSFLFLMAALVWPAELYLSLIPLGKTNMSAHSRVNFVIQKNIELICHLYTLAFASSNLPFGD